MYAAVSMWSLLDEFKSGRLEVQGFAEYVMKLGIKHVEILDYFFEDDSEILKAVSVLRNNMLQISAYSICNDFVTGKEEEYLHQIDYVRNGIDMASKIGTKHLRVFSGNPKEGIAYDDGMHSIIDGFKQCAPYAEEKDICLVLENHGLFAGKSSQVMDIIEKVGSPNLRANIDTANFLLVNENPVHAVEFLKKYIAYVHIKDFCRLDSPNGLHTYSSIDGALYQGTVIGKGSVDLIKTIDLLKNGGYSGCLSIEYEGVGEAMSETAESIEYLKCILKDK